MSNVAKLKKQAAEFELKKQFDKALAIWVKLLDSFDENEIRLMLAEQLTKAGRKDEAIEQLQMLHERYDSEGRSPEAAATATRMRAIDPAIEPRAAAGRSRKSSSGDLIFLDLDTPSP